MSTVQRGVASKLDEKFKIVFANSTSNPIKAR
jgi:hypothetical protein